MTAPTLTQRLKSLMRNARRQGGSQGPKSCASLAVDKQARKLDAEMTAAIQDGDTNHELEARRDLLAQARALYSTSWLSSSARCTIRRAQQLLAQRVVWLARCGDMWGFGDLPELRQRALRLAQQAEQAKVAVPMAAGHQHLQLELFEVEAAQ
ncbi:MAG: hypothetical protein HKL99_00600 [Burkholderiales bacterium]|nr:hypothetical protein [Burkholderiales bacterium]